MRRVPRCEFKAYGRAVLDNARPLAAALTDQVNLDLSKKS